MLYKRLWVSCGVGLVLAMGLSEAAGQLASRSADEWVTTLERPERVEGLRVGEVISRLRLQPGEVVADLGAGTGVFSVPLGKAVSPGGKVYAVEIEEGFFDYISQRAEADGVRNVETVLGEFSDPNLPAQDVDLAFFHDVLHHVEDRAGYLKNLAGYVKPTGRVVIIDFGAGQGAHGDQPELRILQGSGDAVDGGCGFQTRRRTFRCLWRQVLRCVFETMMRDCQKA